MTDEDYLTLKVLDLLMRITLAVERMSPPPREPEADDPVDGSDIWVAPGWE